MSSTFIDTSTQTSAAGTGSPMTCSGDPLQCCESKDNQQECESVLFDGETALFCGWHPAYPVSLTTDGCEPGPPIESCILFEGPTAGCVVPGPCVGANDGQDVLPFYRETEDGTLLLMDISPTCGPRPEGWEGCSYYQMDPPGSDWEREECGCMCPG